MKQHLSNLDELLQKVRNTHSKNYLNEAIASYRIGAYRAALITTWIAVCVDIIEKIKELSLGDDPIAKRLEERLNGINSNDPASMLSFERDILDMACDELQLISAIEKSHLERLKNDRNVCAHPTFSDDGNQFTPLAELALSYIVQASNYLLIHAPVKGKVVIQRLFDLINEACFPEDSEKAFTVLSSENNLGRARESSVRNLSLILLKRVFRDENGISPELLNRISASLGAIERIAPDIYNEVMENKFGTMLSTATDIQLMRVFPFLITRDVWGNIDDAEKIRIEGLIQSMSVDDLVKYGVTKLTESNYEIKSKLTPVIQELNNSQKYTLFSSYPSKTFKKEAIHLFADSRSFDSAELRGSNILIPIAKHFNDDDFNQLFDGALSNTGSYGHNQILYAGDIGSFFTNLYQESKSCEADYKNLWKGFREKLAARGVDYPSLDKLLITDNIIEKEEEQEEAVIPAL
ncbi:hypothetical protein [Vibrio atlanticus]|uniref:Uncharacterized protein n=1 Tax=Vibrio atlanticus TaxID=693153 RepID=A0A1C3IG77_9VIBR|nr:hypothetical protein [Vibrio atlanticus]SBS60369.1 hypothetical protein VAT7223_00135 [Vibrio atlanticus]